MFNLDEHYRKFIDEYAVRANAAYCMVYLYAMRHVADGGAMPDNTQIANVLHILESDVAAAWRFWEREGKATVWDGAAILNLDGTVSDARYSEIDSKMTADHKLAELYAEAARVFGAELSSADVRTLYSIYEDLKISTPMILMLVAYAKSNKKTMRYVEKTAICWKQQGVDDMKKADKYFAEIEEKKPSGKKKQPKATSFSNFKQRDDSYKALEELYFDEVRSESE